MFDNLNANGGKHNTPEDLMQTAEKIGDFYFSTTST